MAAFSKRLLVLALVLAALSLASGTAYAQFHPGVNASLSCQAFAVPAQSRAEGIAELLGDVVAQCRLADNVTTGFPPTLNANIAVTLNVNVTNNINFGAGSAVTDAILLVNEVWGASTIAGIAPTAVRKAAHLDGTRSTHEGSFTCRSPGAHPQAAGVAAGRIQGPRTGQDLRQGPEGIGVIRHYMLKPRPLAIQP